METLTFRRQLNGLTRVDMEEYFDDVELENLYQWIDRIPLTRPKKNIGKDFSDGGNAIFEVLSFWCTQYKWRFARLSWTRPCAVCI